MDPNKKTIILIAVELDNTVLIEEDMTVEEFRAAREELRSAMTTDAPPGTVSHVMILEDQAEMPQVSGGCWN